MLSIIQLLADPNPSDPINPEAARLLEQYPEDYHRRVRLMIEQEGGMGRQMLLKETKLTRRQIMWIHDGENVEKET